MTRRFQPTPEERAAVARMAGQGLSLQMIGALIRDKRVDAATIAKHFPLELERGRAQSADQVTKTIYERALAGDTALLCFIAKTQLRWTETARHEVTGRDGVPLPTPTTGVLIAPAIPSIADWERMVAEMTAKQQALAKPKDTLQ